jgi:hypothetical protein
VLSLILAVSVAVFVLNTSNASAGSVNSVAYQQCMDWLREHYRQFDEIHVVDEYEQHGKYHLKGNYRIIPYYGPETIIGFECYYLVSTGRLSAAPNLQPFPDRAPKAEIVSAMKEYRVEFGYSTCPNLKSWKIFADEMKKENWSAELQSSCVWLNEGDFVYGPPLARESYEGSDFIQIRLRDGKPAWIEASQLE